MKFDKKYIDNLQCPDKGQMLVWETGKGALPGFGIRLTPGSKTYIVQARVKGISRRIKIGRHGVLTLQEARKMAQTELAKMTQGKDPAVEKAKKELAALTLQEATKKYIADRPALKERTRQDITRHLKVSFANWAEKPITKITRDKCVTLFRELSKKSPAQANQAFRILRAILNYCMAVYRQGDRPIIIENPVKILSDGKLYNKIPARSGRIPTDKIGIVWNVLQTLREAPEQTEISRTVADIACFVLLTGARWGEASTLSWQQINLSDNWWYLQDPKNRQPVTFPLSHVAKQILEARPRESNFVFPGTGETGHLKRAPGIFKAISKISGTRVTAHDLRRTFRAIAGECGLELWKAKLLMNHKLTGDVTISHYTETQDLQYLNPEINQISEWILHESIKARDSEKIVSLPGKVKEGK